VSGPKDPFDFGDGEADRTVIRPAPGAAEDPNDRTMIGTSPLAGLQDEGDRTQIAPRSAIRNPFAPKPSTAPLPPVGSNPLLAAGAPLIALANQLRAVTHHDDVGGLRQKVIEELRSFQQTARTEGAPDDEVRYGHYALCALIDEVVLSTPWGTKSQWPKQSLVATFHNEVVSGDRMLELAGALEARPGRAPNLLELIYVCLSFGFEGRMRLDAQGASRLFQLRERLYNAIRGVRGAFERGLSPQWRGVEAAYQPLVRQIPLWVFLAACGLLAMLIYAGFLFRLSYLGDRATGPLAATYQAAGAKLNRTAPPPEADSRLFLTILDILKPDIDAGRVAVTDSPDAVLVRLKDKGLFASGSAVLDDAYDETMTRVAQAIALTVGDVPVIGHTDNQRIRTLQFSSNQELSDARAATVVGKLSGKGTPGDRLKASGVGESQPIEDNATPEGRRLNRRVEVVIPKTYAAQP
jgi:type VI secretion system protein ImpK